MSRAARLRRYAALALVLSAAGSLSLARPAAALPNPFKLGCTLGGVVSPTAKKACTAIKIGVGALSVLKGLVGSGGSSSSASAPRSAATKAATAAGLAAIGVWVLGGATFAVHEAAKVLGSTAAPQLESTWFSSTYWRVAAIAAVLTLPFLFAAAVQALIRSDITLLLRAALGYLPLAMLAVAIAAPVTMLLLAASDQLANAVSSASGNASSHFLRLTVGTLAALTALWRAPFLVFFIGLLTVAGALTLWIELLVRDAAVYVIVLMMPLVFAAMVWPARRVWAVRAVEILVALILSKFAIVAVLSLGGAALSKSQGFSVSGMIAGVVLMGMGAFAPWALLRLVPLAELASSAAGSLHRDTRTPPQEFLKALGRGDRAEGWAIKTAAMRRDSERGLAVGAEGPAASSGSSGSRAASDDRGGDSAADGGSGDSAPDAGSGDPAADDLPMPEPDPPDLIGGERSNGDREPPSRMTAAEPSQDQAPAASDLPDIVRDEDLSHEVLLGPEGVPAAPAWRGASSPAKRIGTAPPQQRTDDSGSPQDDHDPTPPPQAPSEGRL